jgi:hypothetical protein
MFHQRLAHLEERLAETEKELHTLRGQLCAAGQRPLQAVSRWRMLLVLGLAVTLVGLGVFTAPVSEAQDPDEKAHTVKAPFQVVDKMGKVIMSVEENFEGGQRGIIVRNTNGTDALWMSTTSKGMGVIQAFDPVQALSIHSELGPKGLTVGKEEQAIVSLGVQPEEKLGSLESVNLGTLVLKKDSKKSVEIGPTGVKVFSKDEKELASFGADKTGAFGDLALGKEGKPLVHLKAEKDVGSVLVKGSDGKDFVELQEQGIKMRAPLHVNDKAGKKIMAVEENAEGHRGIVLLNKAEKTMVIVGESKKGNGMVQTNDGTDATTLLGGIGGLAIWKGDILFSDQENKKKHCEIKGGGMKVYDESENPIARFGADPNRKFGALVLGKEGKALVGLVAEGDVGSVSVLRSDEKVVELGADGVQVFSKKNAVARLGLAPSGSGAGYLAIGNASGSSVVEAGMLPEGRGIVRAYPYKPKVGEILTGSNMIIGAKP